MLLFIGNFRSWLTLCRKFELSRSLVGGFKSCGGLLFGLRVNGLFIGIVLRKGE
jgi:hypothetical protein